MPYTYHNLYKSINEVYAVPGSMVYSKAVWLEEPVMLPPEMYTHLIKPKIYDLPLYLYRSNQKELKRLNILGTTLMENLETRKYPYILDERLKFNYMGHADVILTRIGWRGEQNDINYHINHKDTSLWDPTLDNMFLELFNRKVLHELIKYLLSHGNINPVNAIF